MTRIVFAGGGTGGHLYPGLAIARALVRARPSIEPFFVGAQRGIERDVLPTTEFPHLLLDLHPLYRSGRVEELEDARRRGRRVAAIGATGARASGRRWSSAPAATRRASCWRTASCTAFRSCSRRRQPSRLTARVFSRWSREIYLNFPEAARVLDVAPSRDRSIDTGAPIEPPPIAAARSTRRARARGDFPSDGGHVLLVYGGSQGSLAINRASPSGSSAGFPTICTSSGATGRATYDAVQASRQRRACACATISSPIADAYAATRSRARARRRDDDRRAVRVGHSGGPGPAAHGGGRPSDDERRDARARGRGDPHSAVAAHASIARRDDARAARRSDATLDATCAAAPRRARVLNAADGHRAADSRAASTRAHATIDS